LDLRRVPRPDLGQWRHRLSRSDESVPIAKRNDVAQMGKIPPHALNHLNEVAAAIDGLHKDAAGLRLAQHVSGFVAEIGGIDRDERDAGKRGAEFQENPFGRVGGPYRHLLTGSEAVQKRARRPLSGFENIVEAPLAPAWLQGAVNEGCTRSVS